MSITSPKREPNSHHVSFPLLTVADGSSGLQIVNISSPSSPALIGTYNTLGYAQDVTVSGNYAYVADNTAGLQIIDISNPSSKALGFPPPFS